MSFKKLLPEVKEALASIEILSVSEFGKVLFSTIKSGSHVLAIAPEKTGKTEAAIVACFNKVNKELEGAPRVIFICKSIDAAVNMHERISRAAEKLDVTVDLAHDKGNMVQQRNDIFDGTEIIVGTIKRIHDLFIQNGINFKLLDYLIIDDFEDVLMQGKVGEIKRLIESFGKTQLICLANGSNSRVEQFVSSVELDLRVLEAE
ncbi:MAG: DEAD/DEAH box helicase [Crocinitomicaceae bacterium]|nr:DEAD/DEAH box helicase [Crocinitomicaceae bacterium]